MSMRRLAAPGPGSDGSLPARANKAALLDGVAETNPNGSGILLGHPVAATGAILVVKALAPR